MVQQVWDCEPVGSIMKQSAACVAKGRLNFFPFFFFNWLLIQRLGSIEDTRCLSLIMRDCIIRVSLPSLSDSPPGFTLSVSCPQLSPSHMINAHLFTQARHRGAAEGDWQSSDESWDHGADRMVSTVCCRCYHMWGNHGYLIKMSDLQHMVCDLRFNVQRSTPHSLKANVWLKRNQNLWTNCCWITISSHRIDKFINIYGMLLNQGAKLCFMLQLSAFVK